MYLLALRLANLLRPILVAQNTRTYTARGYIKYIIENRFRFVFVRAGPDIPGFLLQPFRKPKRIRTAFSPSQLLKLEHAFEKNHYVVGAERKQLAQSLSLTETQVSVTDIINVYNINLRKNTHIYNNGSILSIIQFAQ